MSNRKEILTIKYLEFKQHLDSIEFNTSLFPSLEDVDIVDLLFFFNLFFPESPDYEASVRSVATNFGYEISDEEYSKLTSFLKDCLDRKKLQRVKDVIYDKTNGEVKDIPALHHNKQSNHFTLKNTDKHVSTTRSLAPKKVRGTAKNVVNYDSETSI